jgi:hypothetical protein
MTSFAEITTLKREARASRSGRLQASGLWAGQPDAGTSFRSLCPAPLDGSQARRNDTTLIGNSLSSAAAITCDAQASKAAFLS